MIPDFSNIKKTVPLVRRLEDIIIFENDNFVALNKPAGLLSIPDRTQSETSLKDMLLNKYGTIFTVHRLDKDTSGMIVFAKNEVTHKFLSQAFEERRVEKYYQGIVHGSPAEKKAPLMHPLANTCTKKA
jgi:23S rRNA pseudouridine1911/1915/1917 synthase